MADLRRCMQCWEKKVWPAAFMGKRGKPITWCQECVALYRAPGATGARATRRARLDRQISPRVLWVPQSGDRKLGGIPATYSAGSTCPDACALKDQGCYAEFGKLQFHWRRVPERGLAPRAFLAEVAALPVGTLWRHNIAGDLAGLGNALDVPALLEVVLANAGRRGFTFTHKPLRSTREAAAVSLANRRGFTINLSADSLEQADARADLGVGPVVVTLPSDAPAKGIVTPAGRTVVVCPAESAGITCARCQLCAKPQRKAIVGFRAHGQWYRRVDERLRLPVLARTA